MPRFLLLRANVLGFHLALVLFQFVRLEINRVDQVGACLRGSLHGPEFFWGREFPIFEIQRLHHLANEAVRQHHRRIAVLVGQIEGQHGELGHLLHGSRRHDEVAVIAMAPAFDHREVIALLGRDVSQAGSAAHHVDDDAGQLRTGKVGDALLHKAEAGTG